MRNYPNIEQSAFRAGEYIGYDASGDIWHIRKNGREWIAFERYGAKRQRTAPTLALMSIALENTLPLKLEHA